MERQGKEQTNGFWNKIRKKEAKIEYYKSLHDKQRAAYLTLLDELDEHKKQNYLIETEKQLLKTDLSKL